MRIHIRKRPTAVPFGLAAIGLWCIALLGVLEDDWQKSVTAGLVASMLSFAFWRLTFRSPIWIEVHGYEIEVGLHNRSYRVGWQDITDIARGDYRGSLVSCTVFVRGGRSFTVDEEHGAMLAAWLLQCQGQSPASCQRV